MLGSLYSALLGGAQGVDAPAWFAGAVAGVGGYVVLYGASKIAHSLGFVPSSMRRAYEKLESDGVRADWDARLPSTVHAIAAVLGSYSPAMLNAAHTSSRVTHYDSRLFVDYGVTGLGPEFFMGMFVTYLLSDLSVMAYYAFVRGEYASNFWPSVAHHVLASASWTAAISTKSVQWYGCFWMIAELSTVFVNLRHMLYKCDLKSSAAYFYNGLAMTLSFFAVRVLPLPFTLFNFFSTDAAEMRAANGTGFAAFISFCVIFNAGLQSYWFGLMAKGALKVLLKGDEDAGEAKKKKKQ